MHEGRKCEGCTLEVSSSHAGCGSVCMDYGLIGKVQKGTPAQGGGGAGDGMDRCGQCLIHEKQCSWCKYVESKIVYFVEC